MVSTGDLFGVDPKARTPRGAIPRWAERYGYSVRQIKNWIQAGRDAQDMPPFEEPGKLAAWCDRVLGKVPPKLAEAIERLGGKVEPVERPAAAPIEMPEVRDDELGIEAQLEHFRREMVMLQKLRRQAFEAGEMSKATGYLDQMRDVSAEIRQMEKMMPQLLQARGEMRPTDEVRRETVQALKVLRTSLLSRGRKARARLVAIGDEDEATRIWAEEIENAFREAAECGFEETLVLEA